MRPSAVPADLATLAWAEPGQELEIRRALPGAGALAELLVPGARVTCSTVDDEAVVVETVGEVRLRIPLERAGLIQVERSDVGFTDDR